MVTKLIRFLIQVELGIRWLVTSESLKKVGGIILGAFGASLLLGYFTVKAKIDALHYEREAIFREEVLEAYKRTRGRINPAFCCHKRDY